MSSDVAKTYQIDDDGFCIEVHSGRKIKSSGDLNNNDNNIDFDEEIIDVDNYFQSNSNCTATSSLQTGSSLSKDIPKPQNLSNLTDEDLEIFSKFADHRLEVQREVIHCQVCDRTVDFERDGYQLCCEHSFCKLCLADEINENHDIHGKVRCLNESCRSVMEDEEIQIILGDNFQQFYAKVNLKIAELAEKEINDQKIAEELEIENYVFIENKTLFDCAICFTEVPPGDGVKIKACRHEFCKSCVSEHIKHCEEVEVKCPFNDDNGNCDKFIGQREMRGFVPPDILDIYLQRSLKLFANTNPIFHCKKPDCVGFVEIDENVQNFRCQNCGETNCVECKAIHTGKTCQQYKDEIDPEGRKNREDVATANAIQLSIDAGKCMRCPRCQIPVEKIAGCDYIVCSACKLEICWVTRRPRKPLTLTNGTFIDGCHCRENGKRCHPNCQNCH